MFRIAITAARLIRPFAISSSNATKIRHYTIKTLSSRNYGIQPSSTYGLPLNSLNQNRQILDICTKISPSQTRTVTKVSLKTGKRKTVKAALRRFYRLDWGGWIRPKVGRHKKLWKKSAAQKRRLKQHVFCNSTQSTLLDKMVTKFWKRPKHYVDDPYNAYHSREEFYITRRKPVIRE